MVVNYACILKEIKLLFSYVLNQATICKEKSNDIIDLIYMC